jgi:hypothetical protein
MPMRYRGHLEGGAVIADAAGRVLARRDRREGPGFAIAEVAPGRTAPLDTPPDSFWLHRRGLMPAATWNIQRLHGRPWYERNVAHRPPLELAADAHSAHDPAVPAVAHDGHSADPVDATRA